MLEKCEGEPEPCIEPSDSDQYKTVATYKNKVTGKQVELLKHKEDNTYHLHKC